MSSDPSSAAGPLGPLNHSTPFNALQFQIDQAISRIHTMKPVKVLAVYDINGAPVTAANTGTLAPVGLVDVQPMVRLVNGAFQASDAGTIFGIPYIRMQGGQNAIICDPLVGDIGWMGCSDRDMSNVITQKAVANPGSFRQYNPSDGVYMGGMLNGAPKQWMRFRDKGIDFADSLGNEFVTLPEGIIVTDCNGNQINMSAEGVLVTDSNGSTITMKSGGVSIKPADGVLVVEGALSVIGNIGCTGVTNMAEHVHSGVQPGGGDSGPPTG